MNWASGYIERLRRGETVQFRPRGHSMSPLIKSEQLVTVEPVTESSTLAVGDIVLCRVRGATYLHLIKAVRDGHYQIGNNRGGINGWTSMVFGRCVRVEP